MASNNDSSEHFDFDNLTIDGIRKLFPEAGAAPLISGNVDSGNPGSRILSNDETITEMLKGLNFNDETQSVLCALALGENEIFLYDANNKVNPRVEAIRNRIKNRATAQCSVKGWGIDQYKQASSGVITNTYSPRGTIPLSMPLGKKYEGDNGNNGNKNSKRA